MGWGPLGRIGKGLGGLVDIVEAPVQFAWDVGRAFIDEDSREDGFWSTVWASFVDRSAQAASGAFGREGFGGQLFGAIPEPVRRYPAMVIGTGESEDLPGFGWKEAFGGGLLGFLEGFGREFIREPLATATTVASLMESDEWGKGWGALLDGSTWKKAHEISQSRSMGQAVAMAFLTKDILDEDEVMRAQNSSWYGFISGSFDAAARIFLDTDTLLAAGAGKGLKAARASTRLGVAEEILDDAIRHRDRLATAARTSKRFGPIADDVIEATEGARITRQDLRGRVLRVNEDATLGEKVRAGRETAVPFGDEAELLGTAAVQRARRTVGEALGHDVADDLDAAVQRLVANGDNEALYRWAEAHDVRLSAAEVAEFADDAEAAWANVARKAADAGGFNYVEYTRGDQVVESFSLDNFDPTLAKSINRTLDARTLFTRRPRFPTDPNALGDFERVRLTFEAIRKGGWEQALKDANGRVDQAMANVRYAREYYLRSSAWKKVKGRMAQWSDELPLGQRIERIRDTFYRNDPDGDNIATWFALARDDHARDALQRVLLGEHRAYAALAEADPAMARDVQMLMMRRYVVRHFPDEIALENLRHEWDLLSDPSVWARSDRFAQTINSMDEAERLGDVAQVLEDIEYYTRGAVPRRRQPRLSAAQQQVLRIVRANRDGLSLDDLNRLVREESATLADRFDDVTARLDDAAARLGATGTPAARVVDAADGFRVEIDLPPGVELPRNLQNLQAETFRSREGAQNAADALTEWATGLADDAARLGATGTAERRLAGISDDIQTHDPTVGRNVNRPPTFRDVARRYERADDTGMVENYTLGRYDLADTPGSLEDLGRRGAADSPEDLAELREALRRAGVVNDDDTLTVYRGSAPRRDVSPDAPPGATVTNDPGGNFLNGSLDREVAESYGEVTELRVPLDDVVALGSATEEEVIFWRPGARGAAESAAPTAAKRPRKINKRTLARLEREGLIEVLDDGSIRANLNPIVDVLPDTISDAWIELERLQMVAQNQARLPSVNRFGEIRLHPVVQKVWQSPRNMLRVAFDMVAPRYLVASDPMITPKLKRHLRDAGFSPELREHWLGRFAAARFSDEERLRVLTEITQAAVETLGAKHGVGEDVVRKVATEVAEGQRGASEYLRKAARYGGKDPHTKRQYSRVTMTDPLTGEVTHTFVPLTPEQLANAHVMPNFREIDKALRRVATTARQWGYKPIDLLTKAPIGLLDGINRAWKPWALMRPAWPMRVVFDEQVRMAAVIGVMETLAQAPRHLRDLKYEYIRNLFPSVDKNRNVLFLGVDEFGNMLPPSGFHADLRGAKRMASPTRAARGLGAAGALGGFALAGAPGAVAGALLGARSGYRGAQYANGLQMLHLSSTRNLAYDGYTFAAHLGHPGDVANLMEFEISAQRDLSAMLERTNTEELNRFRFDRTRWTLIDPSDPAYKANWQKVVNHQFGNSQFSRLLWSDRSNDEIVDWLTKTPEGRKTLRTMPKERRENVEDWVEEARSFLDTNVLPRQYPELDPLRERLANGGKVSFGEVQTRLGPDWDTKLDSIHGMAIMEVIDQSSQLGQWYRRRVDNIMRHLGTTSTDVLSRQPFFAHRYQHHMQRQLARLKAADDGLFRATPEEIQHFSDQARRLALHDTRTVMYDLAEESLLAQKVRFIMPFFNAWQEVLTRYASIARDNPLFMARGAKAYQGIDELGQTYEDEFGNKVQRFRIPDWARALVDMGIFKHAVDSQGYIAFNKSQLNMLGEGLPGFGPIVNVAFGKALETRPSIEQSIDFMFPFGVQTGLAGAAQSFMPTAVRRLFSMETEDRAFQNLRAMIALNKLTTAQEAGATLPFEDPEFRNEFYRQVTDETQRLYMLRAVGSMVLPITPQFQSPYQDYIDAFRELRREHPEDAEMRFLERYGEDYFALTQSLSKVHDGVAATVEGEQARAAYRDLVEAYPEFGRLITGEDGGGVGVKFSRAIYNRQFQEPISPGNPQKRRSPLPLDEIVTSPEVRLGWLKWQKFNDWKIDQMDRLGVTSLRVKEAQALREVQEAFIMRLAQEHPEWYTDFNDDDETRWRRRMTAFNAIANTDNTKLANRPDIRGLRNYLNARREVEKLLAQRKEEGGSDRIDANANADIAYAWDTIQQRLKETNPAFSDLHARWLENDYLVPNSWLVNLG